MSRIAGVVAEEAFAANQLVHDMLSLSKSSSDCRVEIPTSARGQLGWCGWTTPQSASVRHVRVVLDGVIYNRRELLNNAEDDATTIAQSYMERGFQKTVSSINGDFALALYDDRLNKLYLARDRFGLKPLYYSTIATGFVFASRIRALLASPDVSSKVDPSFVARFAGSHYRTFDNDPHASPYKAILQLPAGHFLTYSHQQVTILKYWSLEESADLQGDEADLAQTYCELLTDSVRLRFAAAKTPAFTLSGGMDSSSVLACAVRSVGTKQHAFSTVYEDKTYDESNEIRSMCDSAVEEWHPILVDPPDLFPTVRAMIEQHDEPVATATWLSHYQLCKEVRAAGFKALFGGLGGDELNAGEYEYFFFFFADLLAAGRRDDMDREIEKWVEYHNHPIFAKSRQVAEDALSRLVDLSEPGLCRPDANRLERYRYVVNPEYFDLRTFQPEMDHMFSSYLKNRTFHDIFRETVPCCLRAEDRQCTAAKIENFLPFFDHRLIEFMFRISGDLKIRNGVTKHLLREAMRGVLPEETRTRIKKTGWNAPAHIWFSKKGRDDLMDLVNSKTFRERGIYNHAEVLRLIKEHDDIVSSGRPQDNHMMFLWQLINLEIWLQYVDQANRD